MDWEAYWLRSRSWQLVSRIFCWGPPRSGSLQREAWFKWLRQIWVWQQPSQLWTYMNGSINLGGCHGQNWHQGGNGNKELGEHFAALFTLDFLFGSCTIETEDTTERMTCWSGELPCIEEENLLFIFLSEGVLTKSQQLCTPGDVYVVALWDTCTTCQLVCVIFERVAFHFLNARIGSIAEHISV